MSKEGLKGSFSHMDAEGGARMVDVGDKQTTRRRAQASVRVNMAPETVRLLIEKALPKGDVLTVARVAGISAAKNTSSLIPLCHPLALDHVAIDFNVNESDSCVEIQTTIGLSGKTGAEMEALSAAAAAALTIYDMCKAVDRGMTITDLGVTLKTGGKSDVTRERGGDESPS